MTGATTEEENNKKKKAWKDSFHNSVDGSGARCSAQRAFLRFLSRSRLFLIMSLVMLVQSTAELQITGVLFFCVLLSLLFLCSDQEHPIASVVFLIVVLGTALHETESQRRNIEELERKLSLVHLKGSEEAERKSREQQLRVTIEKLDGIARDGMLRVLGNGRYGELKNVRVILFLSDVPWLARPVSGDVFVGTGTLRARRPESPFTYEAYLWRRGILGTITPHELNRNAAQRQVSRDQTRAADFVSALTLGEVGRIGERTREDFALLGMSHLFSISGYHIAVVFGVAYACAEFLVRQSRFLLTRGLSPMLQIFCGLFAALPYAMFAGSGVATLRAALVLSFSALSLFVLRRAQAWHSLWFSVLACCLIFPGSFFEVGFQLSFAAVFGLVLAMELSRRTVYAGHRLAKKIHTAILAALLAWSGSGAVALLHFGQVAPASVFANLVFAPLLSTAAIVCGGAGRVFAAIGIPGAQHAQAASEWVTGLLLQGSEYVANVLRDTPFRLWNVQGAELLYCEGLFCSVLFIAALSFVLMEFSSRERSLKKELISMIS